MTAPRHSRPPPSGQHEKGTSCYQCKAADPTFTKNWLTPPGPACPAASAAPAPATDTAGTSAHRQSEAGTARAAANALGRRRLGKPQALAGLAVGTPCVTAACSAPATPTASQTSAPASTSVTAQLETIASQDHNNSHICGHMKSAGTLAHVKVSNNGWAMGTITARNPHLGNAQIVFKYDSSSWTAFACGSDFGGDRTPGDVLTVLKS